MKSGLANLSLDESEGLEIHKTYSQSNCQLECALFHAQKTLHAEDPTSKPCTPWYFPFKNGSSTYCDPWKAKRFYDIMLSYEATEETCQHCLPDCQKTIYNPSVTTLPFRLCQESNLGVSQLCNFVSQSLL